MKGRPRIFRDEDVNQPFPTNINDSDMNHTDANSTATFPLHGFLEASVSHAKFVCPNFRSASDPDMF
jgi:hypothetical protein